MAKGVIRTEATKRIVVYLKPGMVAQVNEWRRGQSDLPPFTEAVRRLLEVGLGRAGKEEARAK